MANLNINTMIRSCDNLNACYISLPLHVVVLTSWRGFTLSLVALIYQFTRVDVACHALVDRLFVAADVYKREISPGRLGVQHSNLVAATCRRLLRCVDDSSVLNADRNAANFIVEPDACNRGSRAVVTSLKRC